MRTGSEVLGLLKHHKTDLEKRFSVRRIGLFGSVLHDRAGEGSDVDILVELGEPTFDHYMDLKFYLEEQLGMTVDLVLADTVKPRLKPIIAREVVYAYWARVKEHKQRRGVPKSLSDFAVPVAPVSLSPRLAGALHRRGVPDIRSVGCRFSSPCGGGRTGK